MANIILNCDIFFDEKILNSKFYLKSTDILDNSNCRQKRRWRKGGTAWGTFDSIHSVWPVEINKFSTYKLEAWKTKKKDKNKKIKREVAVDSIWLSVKQESELI